MTVKVAEPAGTYGGPWTRQKLRILERYLDAYTTALKNQPFKLMYIDAFAGTGQVTTISQDGETTSFLKGSVYRAIEIGDRPFDKMIFVEKDPDRCADLERLCETHSGRDMKIVNSGANTFLSGFQEDWSCWRGVLFLDPFATEVEWSTIKRISQFNALDTWILFPVSAISRILPTSRTPDDISERWATRLTRIFGDESWRDLYQMDPQLTLFGDIRYQRDPGVSGLIRVYKRNLTTLFGRRFLKTSKTLRNSTNTALFEFMFCVGSPRGIGPATRIAKHILEHL